MSLTPLIPIAGVALRTLASKAVESLSDGLAFAREFAAGHAPTKTNAVDSGIAENLHSEIGRPSDLRGELLRFEQLRRETDTAIDQFQQTLLKRLSAAGIDLSKPIQLQSDGFDGIAVGAEHPQWSQIEQLLADDPQLSQAFHDLAQRVRDLQSEDSDPLDFQLVLDRNHARVKFMGDT